MNAVTKPETNAVASFSKFMDKFKPQMALALPKHLNADRMARLALTAFSTTPKLQECTAQSIAGSIMTASILGLEPGVNGQGFLVPYGKTCTFVPGWKGLVDICNRAGRCTVWTGAVFDGDHFDYQLGDSPFVRHRPGDEDDPAKLTHVYAVGRVNGSEWPVIEVWTMSKIWKHRDQYNKVGNRHYSFRDAEMYARKVPLLQVLKYMPSSVELSNALAASHAAEEGKATVIDGDFVSVDDRREEDDAPEQKETYPQDQFNANLEVWTKLIQAGRKTADQVISMAQTKYPLTDKQQQVLKGIAKTADAAKPTITFAKVSEAMNQAKDQQALDDAATLIGEVADPQQRTELSAMYERRVDELVMAG